MKQKTYLIIKRIIDILLSIIGITIMSLFIWWWVIIINTFFTKFKPLYLQKRYGYKKKIFVLIKFRSMKVNAPEIPPRIFSPELRKKYETKFGKFLRVTSIDETPQLFNILIGQMSFVGPRPGASNNEEELVKAREKYTPNAFDLKPGLTGLAQIKMKRQHSLEMKSFYDSEYVKNVCFKNDFVIFFLTLFHIY